MKKRFSPFKHLAAAFRALPRKRKSIVTAGVALVLLGAFMTGNVYGRYVMDAKKTGVITAKKFYFTSSFLNGTHYQMTGDSVVIDLSNSEAGNVSQVDVTFEIEVKDITAGGPAIPPTVEMPTPNVLFHPSEDIKYITLTDMAEDHTYQVTVVGYHAVDASTRGYEKELSATITIKAADDAVYKWVQQAEVGGVPDPEHWELIVWRYNGTGNAEITMTDAIRGQGVLFDPSDSETNLTITNTPEPKILDNKNFLVTPNSHTYDVYNPHKIALTAEDFIVKVGDKTAITKDPYA